MRRLVVSLVLSCCIYVIGFSPLTFGQAVSAEQQIANAVEAAPEEMREDAGVIGYDPEGEYVRLRKRANHLICLADDPQDERFHVACYHESLEPFMKRGRELRVDGKSGTAVDSIRLAEIRSGELSMPDHPAALYSLTGSEGSANAPAADASRLHVVYVPYATGEETGLPTRPEGDRPWLMDAGMPWAHIMISSSSE